MNKTIVNAVNSKEGVFEININSDIGESFFFEGYTAASLRADLSEAEGLKKLKVNITSYGGSVTEGLAIYEILKGIDAEVETNIIGYAASMATIIAMSAVDNANIKMGANSYFIIHNPFSCVSGDAAEMEAQAKVLNSVQTNLKGIYTAVSGQDEKTVQGWMDETKWFTAEEAKEYGFIGEITEGVKIAAELTEKLTASGIKNIPDSLKRKNEPIDETGISKITNAVITGIKAIFAKDEPETMTKQDFEAKIAASADSIAGGIKAEIEPQIEAKDAEIIKLKEQVAMVTAQVLNQAKAAGDTDKSDPSVDGVDRKPTNAELMNGTLEGWGKNVGITNL